MPEWVDRPLPAFHARTDMDAEARARFLTQLAVKLDGIQQRRPVPAFEGAGLGKQLREVALLIAAGIDTPVYRVHLGGFDTHDNQHPQIVARWMNFMIRDCRSW